MIHASMHGVSTYLEMLRFWRELRGRYDSDELLGNPAFLHLVSYLNRDAAGYNPWRAIAAQPPAPIGDAHAAWAGFAGGLRLPGAATAADDLWRRVDDGERRPFGRVNFCAAMELYLLGDAGKFNDIRSRLETWRIPRG
jgi:hypothetical protein